MTTFISFTSTVRAYINGELKILPDAKFAFGCGREHVIRNDDLIPMQVTWSYKNLTEEELERYLWHNNDCKPEEVRPSALEIWRDFESLLHKADEEGRITWECGNYYQYRETNPDSIWPGH